MGEQKKQNGSQLENVEMGAKNLRLFSFSLIILELIIIPIYAVFLRIEPHNDGSSIGYNYPSYMDLIVMLVIGTSFLNTFIKTYSYTGMVQGWIFYVVSIQIFFLFSAMWRKIFFGHTLFDRGHMQGKEWTITIRQQDYTLAAYSCSVMNIVFGVLFGRTGFFQKLIIVIIGMLAYTFNVVILNDLLKVYDVGGSIFCHTFGAYFAMGISFVISRVRRPNTKIQHNYETIIFSYLGCFLIFCFAPSINSQYLTDTPFEKSIVIMNTILSMCASVMVSFAMSILLKDKFSVIDLFNGSLCGSIGAGSSTGLFVNPAGCMILGAISGIVCVLGMRYLSGWLEKNWTIFDTFGVHNVRGLPGIIGGFGGAIAIALSSTISQDALKELHFLQKHQGNSIGKAAAFQIVGTVETVIFGILAGILTGKIVTRFYDLQAKHFFMDNVYFHLPQESEQKSHKKEIHLQKKQTFVSEQASQTTISINASPNAKKIKFTGIPLTKKITFKQKIDQTVQHLNNPPVQEQEDQHSQFQQEMKRKREQIEKLEEKNKKP